MDKYTGKRLDGRYEIQELIGVGGMAVVYRAYDSIDDRTVAIKILKDEFLGNEDFIRRFKNESKAIAVLSHPNIVKVYDVSFGDRIQYIVMEYIDGITLKEYIDQQKDIKWKEALHFTVQILRALQHAHEKGIIHRDIKPQNIMLLQDGTIKVTDFGIARFSRSDTRTMTDKAIGSVHYIAPEQARGDMTDEKADIYSVGVMLYEMITGQLPFEADNAVSVAIMQLQAQPRKPREINPEIPEALEEITLKAMQKEPSQRYQSAAEMLQDIEAFRRNPSIRFQYKYFIDETPTKYVDAINTVRPGTSITPAPPSQPATPASYDDGYEYEEDEKAKPAKSPVVHILGGIGIAVLLVALVLGIMAVFRSCQTTELQEIDMPNFIGMSWERDIKPLNVEGEKYGKMHFNLKYDYDPNQEEGIVLAQDPMPSGKKIKEDFTFTLTINSSSATVPVPDVVSKKQEDAEAEIKKAELVPEIQLVNDENTAAGVVISTTPAKGTMVSVKSTVVVLVSKGPSEKKVQVPQVINSTFKEAKRKLEEAGLTVATPIEKNSSSPKGYVLECDPMEFREVSVGTVVQLTISSGVPEEIKTDVHVQLPANLNFAVNFQALVNGEEVFSKTIIPSDIGIQSVSVTGTTGKVPMVVKLNGQTYWTCIIDFDDNGSVKEEKYVENFYLPNPSSKPDESNQPSESEGRPYDGVRDDE